MENPKTTNEDYENIDIPYNSYLERSEPDVDNGSVMEQPVKSEGDLNDLWITSFIRSTNWKPKKNGFYINGQTGYAEFMDVFVSGNIEALTGTIGGFTIGATTLSATDGTNTTVISSGATAFAAGPTGSPTVTITQAGSFTATNGNFSGTITGSTITGGILQTATTGARVVISSSTNDIRTYDSSNYLRNILTSTQLGFWYNGNPIASLYADEDGFQINGGSSLTLNGTSFFPYSSGTNLGNGSFPWGTVYADDIDVDHIDSNTITTSSISTSGITFNGEAQPAIYSGYVNSNGTYSSPFPSGWGCSNPSTGNYTISHGFNTTNYAVVCVPRAGTVKDITVIARNPNDFTVRTSNLSDVAESNDWMFIVTKA